MPDREIIENLSNQYYFKILSAFNNNNESIKSIQTIAKSLKDIYRYFEPSFFDGHFFVCKNFNDTVCLSETKAISLYDKSALLNRTSGFIIIQVFNDRKPLMWETESSIDAISKADTLIYHFNKNKEFFLANELEEEITIHSSGSRFATEYVDLIKILHSYKYNEVFHSSCTHFANVWYDANKIFFKGGGSGSNIPEKFMQISLHTYLSNVLSNWRGISIEPLREFNTDGSSPKPVDIRLLWRDANRIALIEIKFLGTVKGLNDKITTDYDDKRANKGYFQLKGYYDKALSDMPTTIVKSYLIVIDGRRNNLNENTTSINLNDGMYFKDTDLKIDTDKKYYESIPGIDKPIRMFTAPICT